MTNQTKPAGTAPIALHRIVLCLAMLYALLPCCALGQQAAADPLPSWADRGARSAILAFVERVTREGSPDFVPVEQRIAVFDNDGTLWSEQPVYFQALFACARLRTLAKDHPEWNDSAPFQAAIAGDLKQLLAAGKEALEQVLFAAHANTTAETFAASVRDWLATAKHPTKGTPFPQLVYQPMLELLTHLRANGFKTFIVTGGGIDFVRVFAEQVYGIPPEQVVGSSLDAEYELRDGVPVIVKQPKLSLLDDGPGKPVGIYRHIGRRPIFAAGNSDGDLQMLQYTTIPRSKDDKTPTFALLVHHTDAEREWAYDRDSHIGRLDKALTEAGSRGWVVVDMKADWKRVHQRQ